jgi:hypothetical protein
MLLLPLDYCARLSRTIVKLSTASVRYIGNVSGSWMLVTGLGGDLGSGTNLWPPRANQQAVNIAITPLVTNPRTCIPLYDVKKTYSGDNPRLTPPTVAVSARGSYQL